MSEEFSAAKRKFEFTFSARRKGALGLWSRYTAVREGANAEEAQLALYEEWEHIAILACREVSL